MTILKRLEDHAVRQPGKAFLVDRKNGENVEHSYAETQQLVEAVAKSLAALLDGPGHGVSIDSKNRAHWVMADFGILRSGNFNVPVFTSMPEATFEYAMEFAEIELLFVGEAENWNSVKTAVPDHVKIVRFPGVDIPEADYSFDEFLGLGNSTPLPDHPDPHAPCTAIFTSGTTGLPKGVVHSLSSLDDATRAMSTLAGPQSRFFSYLPLAHLGDRLVNVMHGCLVGGTVTINDNLKTLVPDMQAATPTFMLGVPRIWEKLSQGVIAQMGGDADDLTSKLEGSDGQALAKKIRSSLGLTDLTMAMTSTAPTPLATKQWWEKLGIHLCEGYAQTEMIPITTARNDDPLVCGLGRPAPGVEIRIGETGEIICRGPGMSLGYYKNPEKTAETFKDGWVHTGDKGLVDENGYLQLTGRVSEIFKTAKGKYVAPAPIEGAFSGTPLVEQVCLYGLGLAQPIMLCCLSETAADDDRDSIERELTAVAEKVNQTVENHESIGGVIICTSPWSVENGILTHTLKVKRDRVEDACREEIDALNEIIRNDASHSVHIAWV